MRLDDDDAAVQVVQRSRPQEAIDEFLDGVWFLATRSEHDDAGVATGWIVAEVADTAIEGDHHPALVGRGPDHGRVRVSGQLFVGHGVDLMSSAGEFRNKVVRQVLVQLELHAGSGWISSRASAAP